MVLYAYTRSFANETGAAMHLALKTEAGLKPLCGGFGVLFAKCVFDDTSFDGTSKGLVCPWIFRRDSGDFGVVALRTGFGGVGEAVQSKDEENCVLFFRSDDLIDYEELGLFPVAPEGCVITDVRGDFENGKYRIDVLYDDRWHSYEGSSPDSLTELDTCAVILPRTEIPLHDALPACDVFVSSEEARRLLTRFTAPEMPSDYPEFPFPFTPPRGDPMAILYKGRYLYMATDDEHGQKALKLRAADRLCDIKDAEDNVIFSAHPEGDLSDCLWAPELHLVGDRLCIFFAAGMPYWYTVQSRVMWLIGDDPTDPACWSEPRRMETAEGENLTSFEITLDMTVLNTAGGCFVCWSQRPIIPEPLKCGTADLMIARLNEDEPWRLASKPVLLTRPEYGWERIHSPVDEGPFLLKRDGRLFLTYAAALIDHTYAVGLLTARDGDDLTDPASWHKCGYPILHRLSLPGQIGAGHNSFVKDECGRDILLVHALDMRNYLFDPADGRRYPYLRPVVWDSEGFPHLDAVKKES